jgi:hypothetical protein
LEFFLVMDNWGRVVSKELAAYGKVSIGCEGRGGYYCKYEVQCIQAEFTIEPLHRRYPMSDFATFKQYYNLADQLFEKSSKDDIAETARLLAMNLAHYQSKYGALPLEETLAMISMEKPNGEQIKLLTDAMELLVGVLGNVVTGLGQERH